MTDTSDRYRAVITRLIERRESAAALHEQERAAHQRAAEARDDAVAEARFWRNLAWLSGWNSGRNGIRGERPLPGSTARSTHVPAQRRPPAAEERPRTAGRPR